MERKKKRMKIVLVGEPGSGKSCFFLKAPTPFYVCSDDNYDDYLVDLGAKPEDHVRIYNWKQAKEAFLALEKDTTHETIVVDLFDDLHTWAENDYAKSKGKTHISDFNDFGKSIGEVRNDFIDTITRLLSLDKNIAFIMHGHYVKVRDKFGNETTRFEPSGRMKEKILEEVTGKVGFFLRCYTTTQKKMDGKLEVKRWLSLTPGTDNEYGVIRGIDTENCPKEIPLDWDVFMEVLEQYRLKPIINREDFNTTPQPKVEVVVPSFATAKPVETPKATFEPKTVVEPVVEQVAEKKAVTLNSLVEPDEDANFTPPPAPKVASGGEEKKLSINDLVNRLNLKK